MQLNPDEESRRRLKELQERANPQNSKPILQKTAQEELRELEKREAEAKEDKSEDEAETSKMSEGEERDGDGAQTLEKPDEGDKAGKLTLI